MLWKIHYSTLKNTAREIISNWLINIRKYSQLYNYPVIHIIMCRIGCPECVLSMNNVGVEVYNIHLEVGMDSYHSLLGIANMFVCASKLTCFWVFTR